MGWEGPHPRGPDGARCTTSRAARRPHSGAWARHPRQLRPVRPSDSLSGHPVGPTHGPSARSGLFPLALMNSPILQALRERILFYDGGMGTQLQLRNLGPDDFGGQRWEGCNDYLSLTRPDVVESVHDAYFEAGADVVETNSFQASRVRLEEWGLADRALELHRAAATLARRAADRAAAARPPRLVARSIGPSGRRPSS